MRWAFLITLTVFLTACGGEEPPAPDARSADNATTQPAAAESTRMNVQGMELRMYEDAGGPDGQRTVTFHVRADEGELREDARLWSLEGLSATLYPDTDEEVALDANRGTVVENGDVAKLEDGVSVKVGRYAIAADTIEWDNASGVARSDDPIELKSGKSALNATSLRLNPEQNTMTITDAKGVLYFNEEGP